ncbi:MAG: hypothetical protein CO114_04525, partial [Euryarchaeota archaeon CG_4_9_14_3_um_filter_38_12]
PIKLNSEKISEYLQINQRSISWLAKRIGVSPEVMLYRLKKQVPGDADAIAAVIGEPDPKNLLTVE